MKHLIVSILIVFVAFACNSVGSSEELHVNKGKITISADESFKQIVKAQTEAYKAHYPETDFDILFTPEQKAIGLMLSDSAQVSVVSRELTAQEQRYYSSRGIEYKPARMALDAVVLIVNKENELSEITEEQVADILKGNNSKYKLVFDNSSSSNLNYLLNKFELTDLKNENVSAANGTEDVFNFIQKSPTSIGIIGMNWISDMDDKHSRARAESVKILKVSKAGKAAVLPNANNLRNHTYPFAKFVYLHTNQHRWGVAMGFIRFSCTQIGQLVVEKMGLQPYYLIDKQYEMSDSPQINVVE